MTTLGDEHLDARLGATRDEFMNFLSASLTERITEQVNNQLPQILPEEVPNFAPSVIQKMVKESLEDDKRKTSKDAELTKGPKAKESQSGSSKGDKSQPKSSRKSIQSEEPELEVADSDMPQDQEENPGNDDEEPKEKVASKRDWFTGNEYLRKGQKQIQHDKTKHRNEKSVKSQKFKVNQVKDEAGIEEMANGLFPPTPINTIHSPSSPRLLHLQTKPSLSNLNPTHKKPIPCWQSFKFPFVSWAMTKDEGLRSNYLVNTQYGRL
ncbi:hypothetical protein Tco_0052485 [Tanacetum coccineum]